MRLTRVLNKKLLGRWFNDLWKNDKEVSVSNNRLRQALEAEGRHVYDAAALYGISTPSENRYRVQRPSEVPLFEEPPLPYHETPAFMYEGRNLVLGLTQAQALTNTVQIGETLPDCISALEGVEGLQDQDQRVKDVIKSALMLDATQEKLPKVIDIKRLGLTQPREYGIPPQRANTNLLSGLLGLCERLPHRLLAVESRALLYKPLLQATNTTPAGHRLLLVRRPEMALLSDRPLATVAPPDQVADTRNTPAPSLAPLSPYNHLDIKQHYQWADVFPVEAGCPQSQVHTLFVSWNARLKHQVNDSQLGALSLMCMYAAALNVAKRQVPSADGQLERPVVVQCVATEGQLLKLSLLQLNTLTLPEPTAGQPDTVHSVKNQLWTEPSRALFSSCGYLNGRPTLEGYDPDIFPKLLAFYMNGLIARDVETV